MFKKTTVYNDSISEDHTAFWKYANEYFVSAEPGQGMLLLGPVGNGKTACFEEVLRRYFGEDRTGHQSKSFTIMEAKDIVKDYVLNGYAYTDKYQYNYPLVIDDLGSEVVGTHFGHTIDVLVELITSRYKAGMTTHITSNLTIEEIEKRYGARVMDRLYEMCVLINFTGKSLR